MIRYKNKGKSKLEAVYVRSRVSGGCHKCKNSIVEVTVSDSTAHFECVYCKFDWEVKSPEAVKRIKESITGLWKRE